MGLDRNEEAIEHLTLAVELIKSAQRAGGNKKEGWDKAHEAWVGIARARLKLNEHDHALVAIAYALSSKPIYRPALELRRAVKKQMENIAAGLPLKVLPKDDEAPIDDDEWDDEYYYRTLMNC